MAIQCNAAVLAGRYFNSTLSHPLPTIFFLQRSNNIGQSDYMDLPGIAIAGAKKKTLTLLLYGARELTQF
jgi:hypothetical protein